MPTGWDAQLFVSFSAAPQLLSSLKAAFVTSSVDALGLQLFGAAAVQHSLCDIGRDLLRFYGYAQVTSTLNAIISSCHTHHYPPLVSILVVEL